jgi:hypothetical protein
LQKKDDGFCIDGQFPLTLTSNQGQIFLRTFIEEICPDSFATSSFYQSIGEIVGPDSNVIFNSTHNFLTFKIDNSDFGQIIFTRFLENNNIKHFLIEEIKTKPFVETPAFKIGLILGIPFLISSLFWIFITIQFHKIN